MTSNSLMSSKASSLSLSPSSLSNASSLHNHKNETIALMSSNNNNNANKALADAIAGVCASLISLWVFYPIDVWITNVQAATTSGGSATTTTGGGGAITVAKTSRRRKTTTTSKTNNRMSSSSSVSEVAKQEIPYTKSNLNNSTNTSQQQQLQKRQRQKQRSPRQSTIIEKQIQRNNINNTSVAHNNNNINITDKKNSNTNNIFDQMPTSIIQMFAGWKIKTIHTTCSNFCYFYLYSWIFTAYNKQNNNRNNRTAINEEEKKIPTSVRLILTAVAAMINTILTLPLDTISSQQQTLLNNENSHYKKIETDNDTDDDDDESIISPTHYSSNDDDENIINTVNKDVIIDSHLQQQQQDTEKNEQHHNAIDVASIHSDTTYLFDDGENNNNNDTNTPICKDTTIILPVARTVLETKNDPNDNNIVAIESVLSLDDDSFHSTIDTQCDDCTYAYTNRIQKQQQNSCATSTTTTWCSNNSAADNNIRTCRDSGNWIFISRVKYVISDWYTALIPSLLLSSNPAINFTVYETCKVQWKQLRNNVSSSDNINTTTIQQQEQDLSMIEAFCIGLLSKFIATILTYPLIRAKVILMVSSKVRQQQQQMLQRKDNKKSKRNTTKISTNESTTAAIATTTIGNNQPSPFASCSTNSSSLTLLWNVLVQEYYNGNGILGTGGLYRGISLQLFHTLLKSAFLMMFRERITKTIYRYMITNKSSQQQ